MARTPRETSSEAPAPGEAQDSGALATNVQPTPMATDQSTGELSPSFEDVAGAVMARSPVGGGFGVDTAGITAIKPDAPISIAPVSYADPGHVNPALSPAPLWSPQPDRVVVPVVNDPGVLGANPSLGDLNNAARAALRDDDGNTMDAPDVMLGAVTQDSIRDAAEGRMRRLAEASGAGSVENPRATARAPGNPRASSGGAKA